MPHSLQDHKARRNIVEIGSERVDNITSKEFPGHIAGEDHSWHIDGFRKNFHVQFHHNKPLDAVFSLIGLDAPLANAFRRILLAEIPFLAIEDVFVNQNTSIIQDEVLAHRLGLVPLKGNREGLRWLRWRQKPENDRQPITAHDCDTVQFELKVKCDWAEGGQQKKKRGETDPLVLYKNAHIYASQLHFTPFGQQESTWFTPEAGPIASVHPEILLVKMRPGQEIDMVLHAVRGLGSDHAKFSHVATASYRLLPTIDITKSILGADAHKFAGCFPPGVINVETNRKGEEKAVVKDTMKDTVSRECLRYDEFKDKVKLGRRRDHFIFSVESVGQLDSDELFVESVKVLREKCVRLKKCLAELREIA